MKVAWTMLLIGLVACGGSNGTGPIVTHESPLTATLTGPFGVPSSVAGAYVCSFAMTVRVNGGFPGDSIMLDSATMTWQYPTGNPAIDVRRPSQMAGWFGRASIHTGDSASKTFSYGGSLTPFYVDHAIEYHTSRGSRGTLTYRLNCLSAA